MVRYLIIAMYALGFLRDANLAFHVDTVFRPVGFWPKAVAVNDISATSLDEQSVTGIITQQKTWQAIAIHSLNVTGAKPIDVTGVTIVTTDGTVYTAAVKASLTPGAAVIVELPAPTTIRSFKFKLGPQKGPGKLTIWVATDVPSTHPAPAPAATEPVPVAAVPQASIAPGELNPATPVTAEPSWLSKNWIGVAVSASILGFLAYKKWKH